MSPLKYILSIAFAAIYVCFGYFLERENFLHLSILFGAGFFLYFFFIYTTKDKSEVDILLWISMIFRLIFIVAVPCLSDDYFRFIWDGKLFINGVNPYLFIPSEIINSDVAKTAGLTQELYKGLNSQEYYTFYPPVHQLIFALGGFFSKFGILAGIIAIRIPIIIAEFFTIKYIRKLLDSLQLPHHQVLWYALNPLVIVELAGNLHFEGMMLMCVVIGIYWLIANRWAGAALWWSMAIGIKLIPILFLPILLRRLGMVKSIWFYLIVGLALALTCLPFLDELLVQHILANINLYFQNFEFNASVYSIVEKLSGDNIRDSLMVILMIASLFLVLVIYFYKNNSWEDTLKKMLMAYTIYLLLANTVSPWYIVSLVLLSVFVKNYRYAIVWSMLVLLSYSAYINDTYQENYLLIIIEYSIVICWFIFELIKARRIT